MKYTKREINTDNKTEYSKIYYETILKPKYSIEKYFVPFVINHILNGINLNIYNLKNI